jgi:hypothetical protein
VCISKTELVTTLIWLLGTEEGDLLRPLDRNCSLANGKFHVKRAPLTMTGTRRRWERKSVAINIFYFTGRAAKEMRLL